DFTCSFNSGTVSNSWSAAASGKDAAGNAAPTINESTSGTFTIIHPATTLTTKSVSPGVMAGANTTVEPNTNVTVTVTETNTGDSTITNLSLTGTGACSAGFTPVIPGTTSLASKA